MCDALHALHRVLVTNRSGRAHVGYTLRVRGCRFVVIGNQVFV